MSLTIPSNGNYFEKINEDKQLLKHIKDNSCDDTTALQQSIDKRIAAVALPVVLVVVAAVAAALLATVFALPFVAIAVAVVAGVAAIVSAVALERLGTKQRETLVKPTVTEVEPELFDASNRVRDVRKKEVDQDAKKKKKADEFSASSTGPSGQKFTSVKAITTAKAYQGRLYETASGLKVANIHANSGAEQEGKNIALLHRVMQENPTAVVGGDGNIVLDINESTRTLTPEAQQRIKNLYTSQEDLVANYDMVICSRVVDRERQGGDGLIYNAQGYYKDERTVQETMVAFVPKALRLDTTKLEGAHLIDADTDLTALEFEIVEAFSSELPQDHNPLVFRIKGDGKTGATTIAFTNRTNLHDRIKGFAPSRYKAESVPADRLEAFRLFAAKAAEGFQDLAAKVYTAAAVEDQKKHVDKATATVEELKDYPSVQFTKMVEADQKELLGNLKASSKRKLFFDASGKDEAYQGYEDAWATITGHVTTFVETLFATDEAQALSALLIKPLADSKAKLIEGIIAGLKRKNTLEYVSNKLFSLTLDTNVAGINVKLPEGTTADSLEKDQDAKIAELLVNGSEFGDLLVELACEHLPKAS